MQGKRTHEVGRPLAEACALPGSLHWWSPTARNALQVAGLVDESSLVAMPGPPVITYISRQKGANAFT